MKQAATILRRRKDELATLMAIEMGKPLKQGVAEAEKCAWACEYYADQAERHSRARGLQDGRSQVVRGLRAARRRARDHAVELPVVAGVPFRSARADGRQRRRAEARFQRSWLRAAHRGDIFTQAGFPQGAFRTLLVGSGQVKAMIEHPLVRAVTLTGSTPAGKAVASQAGAALKKTVLELGGSDPYIVLEDADLDHAVQVCATSRLINSGQSCVNAKRFIVVEPLVAPFTEKIVAAMKGKKMGDPLAEGTDIGPQARFDLRDELHAQVRESVRKGAVLLLGGEIPPGAGAFYPATMLTGVKPGMPAYDEELFGPVAAVIVAADEQDAVRIANDSVFGLGAAVFTKDIARGERVARQLEAGCTFVNALVASDPRLPFGGIKESGYGRELGTYGIKEFVNTKTVYIK